MNPIPFFSLKRQWEKHKEALKNSIDNVLDSQQYIGGNFVKSFEEKLSSYLDVKHTISCNSGTDALWLALKALKLKPDSIVLTTPFSFIASSSEVVAHGAHPAFIDIEEQTLNLSPTLLEKWLTNNTEVKNNVTFHKNSNLPVVGIIAVNLFGQLANYEEIRAIANKWNLWIIEDAAQSIGTHLNGKKAGTFGDIATFSFYPTKNMGALGDAGCTTTNDPKLAKRLEMLRNHGRHSKYDYIEHGINSRMDALQAAALETKLTFIDKLNEKRRAIAKRYRENLSDLNFLSLPQEKKGYHIYHQYSILLKAPTAREDFIKHLTDHKIGCVIFYPETLNRIKFLQTHPLLLSNCPVAEEASKCILSLPIWPELKDEEIDYIADTVKKFDASVQTQLNSYKGLLQNL